MNGLKEPRYRIVRWTDKVLRNLLFQSKRENPRTAHRTALSLFAELSHAVYSRFIHHAVISVAASTAFFMLLAIFPGLAALVAIYGFLGDPADISAFIATMPDVIPSDIVVLIQSFLERLISRPDTNLGTFLVGFGIAMWSSNSAMKSLIESLNIVYEREETRSILHINLLATLMTLTFLAFMIVSISVMILPIWNWVVKAFGPEGLTLRWFGLLLAVEVLISALYYFAPCGRQRNRHLLTAGATLASLSWVAMSMLFSFYLTNFANYSIMYGSLGAVAIFMTWLWLTVTILLAGAEVDAAITHLGENRR